MTAPFKGLQDEIIVVDNPFIGKIMYVVPVIPENAPADVQEGIARRRIATLTGTCPCGATGPSIPASALTPGTVTDAKFEHEDDCPAVTDTLVAAVRRWLA